MYDIKQFKPTLYLLLLLGVSGFAMAAESPLLWLVATAGILLNAWLVRSGRFVPLPRIVANLLTMLALLFVILQIRAAASPILAVGMFLVLLHLVKLFEQRANRDYAQLLILSLLLMVAASINTASLLFGLTLILYLFVSLYCCLLFHLKVETDAAKDALAHTGQPPEDMMVRHDQHHLSRSMRRLTGLVSAVAIVMAVLTFLFFPRGSGQGLFGSLQFRPDQTLTGFSDQVSFQKIAQISRNDTVVARVRLTHGGKLVEGTESLLLRGTTLDVYSGAARDGNAEPWQWSRSPYNIDGDSGRDPQDNVFRLGGPPVAPEDEIRQEVSLEPTGTKVLFAIAGPATVHNNRDLRMEYNARDEVIETADPITAPLEYTVTSRGSLPPTDPSVAPSRDNRPRFSSLDPKILAFAQRPEVSGTDEQGRSLAQRRLAGDASVDARIAESIADYLHSQFSYTLDLTDAKRIIQGQDPLVAFLYDLHRGHCEYFAGSMAAMLQSLHIPARVVVGFMCGIDDYNTFAGYYIVKQSNAHAWVEMLTPGGWRTFDPTSGTDAAAATKKPGLLTKVRYLFDYLEFKWANNVVAYDTRDRRNLLEQINNNMSRTAVGSSQRAFEWQNKFNELWEGSRFTISSIVFAGLIGLTLLVLVVALTVFAFERWRLRRRAKRIGLESLAPSDLQRLARQLGFYDDLLRLLERHQIVRPRHLTPLEFSRTLSFLPAEAFNNICRLTRLFYKIRYGRAVLAAAGQRRLATVLQQTESLLDATRRPGGPSTAGR